MDEAEFSQQTEQEEEENDEVQGEAEPKKDKKMLGDKSAEMEPQQSMFDGFKAEVKVTEWEEEEIEEVLRATDPKIDQMLGVKSAEVELQQSMCDGLRDNVKLEQVVLTQREENRRVMEENFENYDGNEETAGPAAPVVFTHDTDPAPGPAKLKDTNKRKLKRFVEPKRKIFTVEEVQFDLDNPFGDEVCGEDGELLVPGTESFFEQVGERQRYTKQTWAKMNREWGHFQDYVVRKRGAQFWQKILDGSADAKDVDIVLTGFLFGRYNLSIFQQVFIDCL